MRNTDPAGDRPGLNASALRQSFRTLLITLQAGLCLGSLGYACVPDSIDLADLPWEIRVVAPVPGQARIQLYLGDPREPVSGFLGLDLQMDLADLPPGATARFHSAGSWAAGDGEFAAHLQLDPVMAGISLSFRRTDCRPVSGEGLLGEIVMDGLDENADPEDLVRLTAGLVLEEVVNGARMAPGITDMLETDGLAPSEPRIWPQPAGDRLNLDWPGESGPLEIDLIGPQGHLLIHRRAEEAEQPSLDLRGLPGGNYWLRCRSAAGRVSGRRVCKY